MRRYGRMVADCPLIPFSLAVFIALCICGVVVGVVLPAHLPHWVYFLTSFLLSYGVLASIEVLNRRMRRLRG